MDPNSPTEIPAFQKIGTVRGTFVGTLDGPSRAVKKLQAVRGHGIKGDPHAGTRLADVRERELLGFGLPKGVEVLNTREVSLLALEDLTEITTAMALDQPIPPGGLGENLLIEGIPKLSQLPSGTLCFFRKDEETKRSAVLAIWRENRACVTIGTWLEPYFPGQTNLGARFVAAAHGRRGAVAQVYSSGFIHTGDQMIVQIPRQRFYLP